jgi:hypothetical protein
MILCIVRVAFRTMGRKILGFHDEYMSRACIIEDKGALFAFVIASSSSTMRNIMYKRKVYKETLSILRTL